MRVARCAPPSDGSDGSDDSLMTAQGQTQKPPSVLHSSLTIALSTLASRCFGLIRDVLFAIFLGSSNEADAFIAAFRLPNLFRRLFAEGAFAHVFIPVLLSQKNRDDFASHILSILTIALVILTIIAQIFMETIIGIIASGFRADPAKFELCVLLARIAFPYLIFMFLSALYGALLNSAHRFLASSLAPILLNIFFIASLFIADSFNGAYGFYLAQAVWMAGSAQMIMLIYAAHRANLLILPKMPVLSDGVKRFFTLFLPALAAGGVVQINIIIGTFFASNRPSAISYLYYAERLYQLPLALIGISLSVALLPSLTKKIAKPALARHAMDEALIYGFMLSVPASVGLFILADPVIAALFEYGQFGFADRLATALTLSAFCLGLPAFVMQHILSSAFFARQDMRNPFYYAFLAMLVNLLFSYLLFPPFGALGIALATSIAAWFNILCLGVHAWRFDWLSLFFKRPFLICLAAIGMGGALYGVQYFYPLPLGAIERVAYTLGLTFFGLIFYLIACHILKLIRLNDFRQEVKKIL